MHACMKREYRRGKKEDVCPEKERNRNEELCKCLAPSVGVDDDTSRTTTALRAVTLARVVAARSQRIRPSQVRRRSHVATIALRIVLRTAVSETLRLAGRDAIGDGGISTATVSGERDRGGKATLRRGISVAAEQVPGAEALSGEESLLPAVV
jgi:hypothetical protein